MAHGTFSISPFTPSPAARVAGGEAVLDGKILLFPVRRDELRGKADGDAFDAADFAPRWWPAPESDFELD